MSETLGEVLDEFQQEKKLRGFEGEHGVQNLCRILNAMGYVDHRHFGQFAHDGSYGDLIEFLADNPGATDALLTWIVEQDNEEWRENLLSHCPEEEEDDFNDDKATDE